MRTEKKLWVPWIAVGILMALVTALGITTGVLLLDQREQTTVANAKTDAAEKTTEKVVEPAESLADGVRAACRSTKPEDDTSAAICAAAEKTKAAIKDAPDTDASAQRTQTELVPVQGPRGPGPTLAQIGRAVNSAIDDVVSAQIDEAVAEQIGGALLEACGGSCNGKDGISPPAPADGKDGTNGTDGKDAPRVRSIACDGTTGVFTFTDDSTIRVSDMCDEPDLLEPDPAPEPTE